MKKKILKRTAITLLFILFLVGVYFYSVMVFLPKDESDLGGQRYYNFINFKKEDKNTIDLMLFGNSDVYSGFSPLEFYRQTGSTSYIRAGAIESAKNIEINLKESLEYQSPSMVIIDADCLFSENNTAHGTGAQRAIAWTAPFALHARWKELELKDFITLPKPKKSYLKGYVLEKENSHYQKPENYMSDINAKPAKIDKSVEQSIKNIIKICAKHNITLFLMCLPTPSSWNNGKSNAITNMANKLNLPFLDLNLPQENFDLNFENCYKDKGNHLNYRGATYTTKYLANYIQNNKDFPKLKDHRSDSAYQDWDKCLSKYDHLIASLDKN